VYLKGKTKEGRKEGRNEGGTKERRNTETMSDKAPIKGRKGRGGRNFYSLIPGNESTKLVIK
jgi:hypothetical protein